MVLFIRWANTISAGGNVGPLVLIVEVDSVPVGTFEAYAIVGLSNTSDPTKTGYLFSILQYTSWQCGPVEVVLLECHDTHLLRHSGEVPIQGKLL